MTLSEIADILHITPQLKDSSVSERQCSNTEEKHGGDGVLKNSDTRRSSEFAVYLCSYKTGIYRAASTINEALHTAFRDLNKKDPAVKMPENLKTAYPWVFSTKE